MTLLRALKQEGRHEGLGVVEGVAECGELLCQGGALGADRTGFAARVDRVGDNHTAGLLQQLDRQLGRPAAVVAARPVMWVIL